jgi:hypothetical protein
MVSPTAWRAEKETRHGCRPRHRDQLDLTEGLRRCNTSGHRASHEDAPQRPIRDEAGEVIGSSGLAFDPRGTPDQCLFTWELMIGDAASHSIDVGERDAGTYSRQDVNTRSWQVAVIFGD